MKKRLTIFAAGLTGLALLGAPALADVKGDKEKNEKDLKKAEERQKGGQRRGMMEKNPLDEILKLMEKVEDRLFESSDTGKFTQKQQRKIVEAMRFEDKTQSKLEELIKKVEEQQQKQQQQQQQQQRQKQKQKNQKKSQGKKTPEQMRKERERQRREKEMERKRQAQKRKQQKKDKKNQPKQDQKQAGKQKRQAGDPPKDDASGATRPGGAAGRWGSLPSKLFQDAANAAKHKAPGRWSDLIKRYRSRLSDAEK